MVYSIKNNTDELVELYNYITLPANETTIVFNNEDESTFESGFVLVKYAYNDIKELIENGCLTVFKNDIELTCNEFYAEICNYNNNIFRKTNINYDSSKITPPNNMYYSLIDNTLNIYNPLSEKWYVINLNERV